MGETSGRSPHRTIRVDDELWNEARDAARDAGTDLSKVIRKALEEYVVLARIRQAPVE